MARIFSAFFFGSLIFVHGAHSQSPVRRSGQLGANAQADQDATFQLTVRLIVKPERPTSYDQTWISIESNPQMSFEVVEIRDETRGLRTQFKGNSATLETLFGPKNGLTDSIVISALVRIPRQSGEKIVRKTIQLRNVPPEVWQNVERHGRVRINVQLDYVPKISGVLDLNDDAIRRELISGAQNDLLLSLAGTDYKVLRWLESDASLLLEAAPDALAVLDRLPQIIKIKEEVIMRRLIPYQDG